MTDHDKEFDYKNQDDVFWKKNLDETTYNICRLGKTERAGTGKYDKFYEQGSYYCACCGGDFPLYRSETKFDSGTGWPSFFQAITGNVIERPDPTDKLRKWLGLTRTEALCARCHAHLGHVFPDGPQPTGKRYCMNSAALVFVPAGQLAKAAKKKSVIGKQKATFAMGCFWCAESAFRDHATHDFLPGIIALRVGYAGGTYTNPKYENHSGYKEAIHIIYDPRYIAYDQLLNIFWHNIDPFDAEGQFCDKGEPYQSAIFYHNEEQQQQAEATKKIIEDQFQQTIKTKIIPHTTFYDAEEYHQNYQGKTPVCYQSYRENCGRDQRLKALWGQ